MAGPAPLLDRAAAVLQDQAGSLQGQAIGGPRGDGLQPRGCRKSALVSLLLPEGG